MTGLRSLTLPPDPIETSRPRAQDPGLYQSRVLILLSLGQVPSAITARAAGPLSRAEDDLVWRSLPAKPRESADLLGSAHGDRPEPSLIVNRIMIICLPICGYCHDAWQLLVPSSGPAERTRDACALVQ
ncbi:unnamed protein product [Diplocarpon coronariae]